MFPAIAVRTRHVHGQVRLLEHATVKENRQLTKNPDPAARWLRQLKRWA